MKRKMTASVRLKRITRPIEHILVHCSETTDVHSAKELNDWLDEQGRPPFGYHFIIDEQGNVEPGIDLSKVGFHCPAPGMEYTSIAVCYLGGKQPVSGEIIDTRTPQQMVALRALVTALKTMFPNADISGHSNHDRYTKCPGFDAKREFADITGDIFV